MDKTFRAVTECKVMKFPHNPSSRFGFFHHALFCDWSRGTSWPVKLRSCKHLYTCIDTLARYRVFQGQKTMAPDLGAMTDDGLLAETTGSLDRALSHGTPNGVS